MRGWWLVDRFVSAEARSSGGGVAYWRARLLSMLLVTCVVLGTVAYWPSAILALRHGEPIIFALDTLVYGGAIVLLLGREIPYRIRSTVLLAMFWTLSGFLLLELGPMSAGPLWLLATVIFTAIFASLRLTLVGIALSAILFVLIERLAAAEVVPWAKLAPEMYDLWLVVAVNLFLLEVMLGLASALVLRALEVEVAERRRFEEMSARSRELELENRRILEANRLKNDFLANLSHELRTPLNAIIGFTELLHDGQVEATSSQGKEFIADVLVSGRHLLQVIDEMLDLAKAEAGRLELQPVSVKAESLIDEVLEIARRLAERKRLVITKSVDPDFGAIVVDPARFKQIAYNYLSNAIKFTPDGGQVSVRLLPSGADHFRLEVADNGIGIASTDLGRLFIEFQQLESALGKRHAGTGLGLALTKRLVEAHGGSVGVTSELGRGSTFFALLPRRVNAG
jgi:signal transduction histidine kinase